jgi:hypothetical protein
MKTKTSDLIGKRVQIPAHTDQWMMGDRYGEIVSLGRKFHPRNNGKLMPARHRVKVKLDKSGKTYTADPTELEFI